MRLHGYTFFIVIFLLGIDASLAQTSSTGTPPGKETGRGQSQSVKDVSNEGKTSPLRGQVPAGAPASAISVAEQVTQLRRTIATTEKRLHDRKTERENPSSEYAQAQAGFDLADAAVEKQRKRLESLPESDAEGRATARAELVRLEKARSLAKERFDLAIEDRKVSTQQIEVLQEKLRRDRAALDKLEGKGTPPPAPADSLKKNSTGTHAVEPASPEVPPTAEASTGRRTPAAAPDTSKALLPHSPLTATPASTPKSQQKTTSLEDSGTALSEAVPTVPKNANAKELLRAEADAQTKEKQSSDAETEARNITERLQSLTEDIELQSKLIATAQKQKENATEIRAELTETFRKRSLAGAPREELDLLLKQVRESEARVKAASDEFQKHSSRRDELQTQRATLQSEQLAASRKAAKAREQARLAESQIEWLKNPLNPQNVLQWLIDHGTKILIILFAMLVGHSLAGLFSRRVIHLIAQSGARGSSVEREARARTLIGVFQNAVSMAIFVGGGLMILQEAGIPIAPLLGGAAVVGLAVAFGAQNLIRDYFYGFVILLENQYKLNDVIQIGTISGQVENITLRMTVLRDLEGRVHFLPNGQITAVTNFTHGWSRALFDIEVGYQEKIDEVMSVLMSLARDLRNDPAYGFMVLEDPTMLGVDQLADSGVVIKFYIKTRPLQQWDVKRELLRRIKNRFDELGIEIPYPHRTLVHRFDASSQLPEAFTNGPSRIIRASNAG